MEIPLFRDRWISLSKCLFNFLTLLHYYARRYYLITLLHSSLPVFLPLPIRYYCIMLLHEYLRKLFPPFSTLLPCYAITGTFAKFCEILRNYALCSFKRYSGYVRYHLITLLREYVGGKCFIFPFSKLLPCYAITGAFINIIRLQISLHYYVITPLLN